MWLVVEDYLGCWQQSIPIFILPLLHGRQAILQSLSIAVLWLVQHSINICPQYLLGKPLTNFGLLVVVNHLLAGSYLCQLFDIGKDNAICVICSRYFLFIQKFHPLKLNNSWMVLISKYINYLFSTQTYEQLFTNYPHPTRIHLQFINQHLKNSTNSSGLRQQ